MSASSPGPSHRSSSTIANGRLGRIVRGYLGACFVAAWALPLGLILGDLVAGHRIAGRLTDFGVVVGTLFVFMIIAAAPLFTAAVVAIENYRLKAAWPFPLIGATIGIVIECIARLRAPVNLTSALAFFALAAVVGAIAGCTYWFLAVRGTRPADVKI